MFVGGLPPDIDEGQQQIWQENLILNQTPSKNSHSFLQMRSQLHSAVLDPWLWTGHIRSVNFSVHPNILWAWRTNSWSSINTVNVHWLFDVSCFLPQAESKSYFPPKGYAFLLFQVIWKILFSRSYETLNPLKLFYM